MSIVADIKFPSFRSAAAQERFDRAYEAALAAWPVSHQPAQLQTGLGPTSGIASGAPEAPPLILLPSFSGTALFWAPNVAALSAHYRVYAVDVIGQPGRSLALRKIKSRDEFAGWLIEVMDGLGVRRAALIGSSFGAFLAMNVAIAEPERVERLILIGPAGVFRKMSLPVVLRLITGGLRRSLHSKLGVRPPRSEALFSRKVNPPPPNDPWRQLMDVILEERPKVSLISPTVFTKAELASVKARTLLLVGQHEQLSAAEATIEKARLLKPDIVAEVVQGADHLASITAAQEVTERSLRFLTT